MASSFFFVTLCEDNGAPIQWQSKRIRRVAKSTLAAECLAMEDAVDAAFYLKCILLEILQLSVENIRVECFIDNKSLYDNLHSSTNVKEEKRLILDIALIKEMLQKNEINSVTYGGSEGSVKNTKSKSKIKD